MEPFDVILDRLEAIGVSFIKLLPQIALAVLVLVIAYLISKAGSYIIRRLSGQRLRRSLVEVLDKLFSIGIWLGGALIAATIAFPSLTPAKILAGIGLGSIAIGFAFKDIFENFLAGILILFREPFRLNDFVECQDIEGRVEDISIRDTHIRKTNGERVVLPNAMLFKNPVHVLTDNPIRRTTVICGVAYGEDVDEAREVIFKAVEQVDSVDTSKDVEIFAQEFADSSINFEVTWWTGSKPLDVRKSRDAVVAAVKRALDDAGIEIPFPYRTLTFKEALPLKRDEDPSGNNDQAEPEKNDRNGKSDGR